MSEQNNASSNPPAANFGQVTGGGLGSSPNVQSLPKASEGPGATTFGQVTGAGLGSSPNVQSLPKASGGEGLTRVQLAEKKAKEAATKANADGPGQTFEKAQG
ncbi:hypothetical protein QFC22_002248 [Naganishia vaughanmartiniae]|uniref:Uncharacterized protein n=1 Tax=Naganishia vaughanmartiniae TaxID=1424756 RepID=A0ACC2XC61_9TREE|nr:hypothetical protein QFC22_002248 [Naganishia vaughanmartiniae]